MTEHQPASDPLHPPHEPDRPLHLTTEIIAEWPPGNFLENLAADPDGKSWLVTSPSDRAVYRVGPTDRYIPLLSSIGLPLELQPIRSWAH